MLSFALQRPLARFVRVVLVLPLFTGCFSGRENDSGSVHHAYVTIARILGCISLFFFANVLKALAAKLMATSFHQETHFKKMQEALQKVGPPHADRFAGCQTFKAHLV